MVMEDAPSCWRDRCAKSPRRACTWIRFNGHDGEGNLDHEATAGIQPQASVETRVMDLHLALTESEFMLPRLLGSDID